MSAYNGLAGSYDGLMQDAEYKVRAAYLFDRVFPKAKRSVQNVLDLGCGTGTIACLLAEQNLDVIAVDASEDMLSQAYEKAMDLEEHRPVFLQQKMEKLNLGTEVDAVISTIDSLNYLTSEKKLAETFRRVYQHLRPGGLFYFDMNTIDKFRRMDRQMYQDETETSYCTWRTFYQEKSQICTYQVDLFTLVEDDLWERDYEEHREHGWTQEQLQKMLENAGFIHVRFSGDMKQRKVKPEDDRMNVWCEKKME